MPKRKKMSKPTEQRQEPKIEVGKMVLVHATRKDGDARFGAKRMTFESSNERDRSVESMAPQRKIVTLEDSSILLSNRSDLLDLLCAYNLVPKDVNEVFVSPTPLRDNFLESDDASSYQYLILPDLMTPFETTLHVPVIIGRMTSPDMLSNSSRKVYEGTLHPSIARYIIRKHIAAELLNICYVGGMQRGCMWYDALDKMASPGVLEAVLEKMTDGNLTLPEELEHIPFARWREETIDARHRYQDPTVPIKTENGSINREQVKYACVPQYVHSLFESPYPYYKFDDKLKDMLAIVTRYSAKMNIIDSNMVAKTIELDGNFVENCGRLLMETGADFILSSYLQGVPEEDLL